MGAFTKIPADTFDQIQMDAGVLLSTFDPDNPAVTDAAIIAVTTGGINATCVPTYSDMGEDVDNCPNNTKELKHLDGWECAMSFTALNFNVDKFKMWLGAADKTAKTTTTAAKVTPRNSLAQTDFSDSIWWVGDKTNGGAVAIELKNALSTGGINMQTTKNGKGQLSVELTGHYSLTNMNVVPMEFYELEPTT